MNNTTINGTARRTGNDELKQWMNVEDIRFGRIYVNAIPLEGGAEVYGYIRDWKNGKVGYSVLDEATDKPDFSECGVFWMAPEDFAKVFMVYREMAANNGADEMTEDARSYNQDSIYAYREKVKKAVMNSIPDDKKADLTLGDVEIVKINDQKLYGIAFKTREMSPSPTFYLNGSYENYIHGMPLRPIVKQLVDSYLFSAAGMNPEMETKFKKDYFGSFDDIKERLAVKVLEKERNYEFLKTVPHKDIDFGFAVVFDVQTVIKGNDVWRMPVTEDILEEVGLNEDDLYEITMKNINDVDPAVLMSLDRKVSGNKIKNLLENDKHVRSVKQMMYVLTNRCGKYGAAALFYPGIQTRIAEKLEDSYYAIPSSLNEFIIVPESSGADIARLHDKLKRDNRTEIHQEEVFSDKIFRYDRESDKLMCIDEMIGVDSMLC